jgi:hypothetical protein
LRYFVFRTQIFKATLKVQVSFFLYLCCILSQATVSDFKIQQKNINVNKTLFFTESDVGNTKYDGGCKYTNLPAFAPVWFAYFGEGKSQIFLDHT